MKKLMLVAAIVCAAAMTHAASFTWAASGNGMDWTDDYVGVTSTMKAYLYLGTVTATETAFNLSGATYLASSGQDDTTYNFGSPDTKLTSSALASDAAGQAYSIVIVQDNGTSLDKYEGWYTILDGTTAHMVNPMDDTDTWANMNNTYDTVKGDWLEMKAEEGGETTPEPTSGLLLLLGVAGMALRRRRA